MKKSLRYLSLLLVLCQLLMLLGCTGAKADWQEQYDLGMRFLSEGNYEEAILAFSAAIDIDPRQPEAYLSLAQAYYWSGDPDSAMEVLERGLAETDDSDIQNAMEELTGIVEEGGSPTSNAESDSEQGQTAAPEVEITNNGGKTVTYGPYSFYWIYSGSGDAYTLIRTDESGNQAELYQGTDSNLYIYGERIYLNAVTIGEDYSRTYDLICIDIATNEITTTLDFGQVVGIDDFSGKLLVNYWNSDIYYIYDIPSGTKTEVDLGDDAYSYLTSKDGKAYFAGYPANDYSETVELWMLDIATNTARQISAATADYDYAEPGSGYSGCSIVGIQITDQAIYYACGYYGGSGVYFQPGGKLLRVSLEDYSTQVLDDIGDSPNYDDPKFYVFQRDGVEYVCYTNSTDRNSLINTATGEITGTDMIAGYLQVPVMGYDGTGSYWVYPDTDGEIIQILPGFDRSRDDMTYYDAVVYGGRYLTYQIVYQKENPNPTSWRDYAVVYKTESYLLDLTTGETTLLRTVEN